MSDASNTAAPAQDIYENQAVIEAHDSQKPSDSTQNQSQPQNEGLNDEAPYAQPQSTRTEEPLYESSESLKAKTPKSRTLISEEPGFVKFTEKRDASAEHDDLIELYGGNVFSCADDIGALTYACFCSSCAFAETQEWATEDLTSAPIQGYGTNCAAAVASSCAGCVTCLNIYGRQRVRDKLNRERGITTEQDIYGLTCTGLGDLLTSSLFCCLAQAQQVRSMRRRVAEKDIENGTTEQYKLFTWGTMFDRVKNAKK